MALRVELDSGKAILYDGDAFKGQIGPMYESVKAAQVDDAKQEVMLTLENGSVEIWDAYTLKLKQTLR